MKRLLIASVFAFPMLGFGGTYETKAPLEELATIGPAANETFNATETDEDAAYAYDMAHAVATTGSDAQDVDMTYKFEMKLELVEAANKPPAATTFTEGVPEGVSYFASSKKTVKGLIWAKPRPSVVADMALKGLSGLDSLSCYVGLLPDVRSVALWDAKSRQYLDVSAFLFGGAAVGAQAKEAFGFFLTAIGADVKTIVPAALGAVDEKDIENTILNALSGDVAIAMGLGIGKSQIDVKKGVRTGGYLKQLKGNCLYVSVASYQFYKEKEGKKTFGLNLVSTNAFSDVYTGRPIPVPMNLALGTGSWTLSANKASINKFAKCADDAEKIQIFLEKSALPKYAEKENKVLDQGRLLLSALFAGGSPDKVRAACDQSIVNINKLKAMLADGSYTSTEEMTVEKLDEILAFEDAIKTWCDKAQALGIDDTTRQVTE